MFLMEEIKMSKYDFEVDLSLESSTGMILNKIPEGAVVLEFGCAAGRMTRYMREALSCQVYVVELDKGAYETARQYAVDGLCDDIMNFRWAEQFRGTAFDAVIFADVLEHLPAPEKVLAEAAKLLKDTGSIYISLPNITHNDILLKAWAERFDYTSTGLLDDTHIHFWGLENLEKLAKGSGMTLRGVEATYCATGATEQFARTEKQAGRLLENILKTRVGGEIYQFVVTLDKNPAAGEVPSLRVPSIKSHIYLDTGSDFNANEIIAFSSNYAGDGCYTAHYELRDIPGLRRIRFDPVEFQGCILRNLTISQNGEPLHLNCPGAAALEDGILLPGEDPMVYTNEITGNGPVTVQAEILLWGERYLKLLETVYISNSRALDTKRMELDQTCNALDQTRSALEQTGMALDRTLEEVESCRRQIGELHLLRQEDHRSFARKEASYEARIAGLNGEIDQCRRDLGSYILLVNQKDMYAMALEKELQYYTGLHVVKLWLFLGRTYRKLRNFLGRAFRGVKRRVKRLLGREEQ